MRERERDKKKRIILLSSLTLPSLQFSSNCEGEKKNELFFALMLTKYKLPPIYVQLWGVAKHELLLCNWVAVWRRTVWGPCRPLIRPNLEVWRNKFFTYFLLCPERIRSWLFMTIKKTKNYCRARLQTMETDLKQGEISDDHAITFWHKKNIQ